MADKKPRVRKVETVRERNEKATLKAEANASKVKKQPVRSTARTIGKPLGVVAKPFKARPVRFTAKWIGLILVPRYFRNAFKELRQVTWPSRRETWKLTFAVLIFAVIFGFLVTVTDYGLDKVIRRIVLR
ncbi:MAG: Protein translocase subunit SecE [Candidatus Saccharibacteria bacterium]|nr:Protein translocase subunit SecE [Candidatus Saccharibacteria bacterium]